MSLKEIQAAVRKMDRSLREDDAYFKTAVILVSALEVGQDVRKLAAFTGYPADFIKERAARLKSAHIWRRGQTYADWRDPQTGGIAFWADVLVAEGMLERAAA